MDSPYILEMRNISKQFPGVKALDKVDLLVKKGMVHVLMGENGAGKSTLMKILIGLYHPDEGDIIFNNEKLQYLTPMIAIGKGISMIHQELSPILEFDVAQSIFLGREPMHNNRIFMNSSELYLQAAKVLNDVGIGLNPKKKIRSLSISEMQLVEIAKAVSRNASLIIMDEPTSSLTSTEVEILFRTIRRLKEKGVAIIYITHKMEEISQIGDDITIMRDGMHIKTSPISELKTNDIIQSMIGRELTEMYPKNEIPIGEIVLDVKNLERNKTFHDISFNVRSGEIVGFAGLVGAGRTEVMRAIFGLDPYDSGDIFLSGRKIIVKKPKDAIQNGIAMIPEDRARLGLVKILPISQNMSLPNHDRISPHFFVNKGKEDSEATELMKEFNVKAPGITTQARALSGGNQQKVVLSKWFKRGLKVLIMDEPTRGIDVGAKTEIYHLMLNLTKKGYAIIMVSSEMPEILGMSDRIYIMREGRIAGELTRAEATQEKIMQKAVEVAK